MCYEGKAIYSYPATVLAKTRNSDFSFVANSHEELHECFAAIIKLWDIFQYIHPLEDNHVEHLNEDDKELLNLTKEEVTALPKKFRQEAIKVKNRVSSNSRLIKTHNENYKLAQQILDCENPKEAAKLSIDIKTSRGQNKSYNIAALVVNYWKDAPNQGVEILTAEPLNKWAE